ncbi:hypothetical protein NliqN6_4308 [Naganishia liquefaciens]|uniref:Ribosome biogenesis protein SLX9 n=1 Tax=Naganishia liquefaciens TaxID=104408 RepID=A0A8H3TVW5_9TREE|nr:hypothetical protein NliqN6_4308 [Naganishia liquefaciens]
MPKATKNPRARLHSKAAASAKAVKQPSQEGTTDDVQMVDASLTASGGGGGGGGGGKKARQAGVQSKIPELRTQFLQTSAHPYSRSHMRRMKRKTREDLSGGSLSAVQEALLGTLDADEAAADTLNGDEDDEEDAADADIVGAKKKRRRGNKGKNPEAQVTNGGFTMIGLGKGKTLKPKQRQQEILQARARVNAVIANPVFKANPFAAIREHAGNTLVKQKTETAKET